MDEVPTTSHSGGSGGGNVTPLSRGMIPPPPPGNTVPVLSTGGGGLGSGGGTFTLSVGQLHTRLGKSSCSATARKLRGAPSMTTATGVACPVSRTISAACRSASAAGE